MLPQQLGAKPELAKSGRFIIGGEILTIVSRKDGQEPLHSGRSFKEVL